MTGPHRVAGAQLAPAPSVARLWRARAAHVVRGIAPPTIALGTRLGGDAEVTQRQARAVIDLALRVGEAMLSTGASASECVATVLRLVDAYGVRSAHVDVTFTSITVSIHRGLHEDPLSVMRVVSGRSLDYTRLEAVQRLVDDVVGTSDAGSPPPDVDQARVTLQRVLAAPHPYRPWVATGGSALMGVGVVMLFGAGPLMWLVAAFSATLVDRAQRLLYRAGVAAFFAQAVSAAVPALIAFLIFWGADHGVSLLGVRYPSLVVVSGIVVLLAGLGLLGAVQDAIDGYYVTAGARGLEMVFMTLGIAVGVGAVMTLGRALELSMEVDDTLLLGANPLADGIGALVIAFGFCLTTYAGWRTTALAMIIAALGWLVFTVGVGVGLGGAPSTALAAFLVGALAYAAYERVRVPELAVATASVVALLPGLALYRAINLILSDNPAVVGNAVIEFVSAAATGLALAGGLSMGGFFARRRFGIDLATQRALRRSRGRSR